MKKLKVVKLHRVTMQVDFQGTETCGEKHAARWLYGALASVLLTDGTYLDASIKLSDTERAEIKALFAKIEQRVNEVLAGTQPFAAFRGTRA